MARSSGGGRLKWLDGPADREHSDQGEPRASAPGRKAAPCGTMNEVSSKPGMLLAPWMPKDAFQIVPPHSSDPMKEGPMCRFRREARARGTVAALVPEHLNALDFNRPNRDA